MFNVAMAEANRLSVFVGTPGRSLWQGLLLGGMCVLGGWSVSVAAGEEDEPGKRVASGQEAQLEQALRARGWDVSRDDDGSLILRWAGGVNAAGEQKAETVATKAREEAQAPTPPAVAGSSPPEAAALLQTINLLRNDGWRVQEDGAGGLLVYPPVKAKPVERALARIGVVSEPVPDRDGDGVADTLDLCPQSAAGERVDKVGCPAGKALQLQNVTFQSGSSQLTDAARRELALHAEVLLQQPQLRLSVLGHTDSRGDAVVNQRLSQLRAESVKQYLLARGLAASRVEAEGRGETQPIADNATVEGRRLNRRVELLIHDSH